MVGSKYKKNGSRTVTEMGTPNHRGDMNPPIQLIQSKSSHVSSVSQFNIERPSQAHQELVTFFVGVLPPHF